LIKNKFYISLALIIILIFNFCVAFSADLKGIYLGVSTYSSPNGSCTYGDRAGAHYVYNLADSLWRNAWVTAYLIKLNSEANESYLKDTSLTSQADLLVYSGHGLCLSKENAAHFFARSTGETWHNSSMEYNDEVNARTNEVRFGRSNLKWIIMYTCNWLTNNGDQEKLENIYKTFEGATLVMGFASTMYLDSREAVDFVKFLTGERLSFKEAFIKAASIYQPQRKDGQYSLVRIMGYKLAEYDSLYNFYGCRPEKEWYKNYKQGYGIIGEAKVTAKGVIIIR